MSTARFPSFKLPDDVRETIASFMLENISLECFVFSKSQLRNWPPPHRFDEGYDRIDIAGELVGYKSRFSDNNHVFWSLLCKRLGWRKPRPAAKSWSGLFAGLAREVSKLSAADLESYGVMLRHEHVGDDLGGEMLAHTLCRKGFARLVDIMLTLDPGIARGSRLGVKCLAWAVNWHHTDVVRLLIGAGAPVNTPTEQRHLRRTALMHLCLRTTRADSKLNEHDRADRCRAGIAKLLIDAGADVNATDPQGSTALFYAVDARLPLTLKEMVRAGADVLLKDTRGVGALQYALKDPTRNRVEVIFGKMCTDLLEAEVLKRGAIHSPR